MSVMGEWVRHLDQLIEAIAASDRSDRNDWVSQLTQARPTASSDLEQSARRVHAILLRANLIPNTEQPAPPWDAQAVQEKAEVVCSLARIIHGE